MNNNGFKKIIDKEQVIILKKDQNWIKAQKRKKYDHFTSLDNAQKILKNKQMLANSFFRYKEKSAYSGEKNIRKEFGISFTRELDVSKEKKMFECFGKNKGCKISFEVGENDNFQNTLINYRMKAVIKSEDELIDAKILYSEENSPTLHSADNLENIVTGVGVYFADVEYENSVENCRNMYDEDRIILNKSHSIMKKMDCQNETKMVFTLQMYRDDAISKKIYNMLIPICIEKFKKIGVKFAPNVLNKDRINFEKQIRKLNYTNIYFE